MKKEKENMKNERKNGKKIMIGDDCWEKRREEEEEKRMD